MNLVQIQENLKDMPLQAVMSYANGSNPQVPAYMAAGELQRREDMKKKNAMAQGAAQGQMPSVKEQLEQKAGLMSLQAQQAQQAQQQMMQQARGAQMPVPENTPRPQEQPQQEMALASGGVAALPVKPELFQYGSGGIIAFDGEDGSYVTDEEENKREIQRLLAIEKARREGLASQAPTRSMAPQQAQPQGGLAALIEAKNREALGPVDQAKMIEEYKARQKEFGVDQPYGSEQEARIKAMKDQYQASTKDRDLERLMAVLGGMSRGSLGGAGPAYLQAVSAERAADMAQSQRENEALAALEKERRAEGLGGVKTVGEDIGKMRESGARTASQLGAQQMQNESQERLHKMDNDLRIALHKTPSPTIESEAIAQYVKQGMSWTEAYERVKQIASGYKGEMTLDQATDNVKQFLESISGMNYVSDRKKKAKDEGRPIPSDFDIRNELIKDEMSNSGRTSLKPRGDVDYSNPLLKK